MIIYIYNQKDLQNAHDSSCWSKNLICVLESTHCQKQYVGKSGWLFYLRLNNYRHKIKSMNQNNLMLVKEHILTNGEKCKIYNHRKNCKRYKQEINDWKKWSQIDKMFKSISAIWIKYET